MIAMTTKSSMSVNARFDDSHCSIRSTTAAAMPPIMLDQRQEESDDNGSHDHGEKDNHDWLEQRGERRRPHLSTSSS